MKTARLLFLSLTAALFFSSCAPLSTPTSPAAAATMAAAFTEIAPATSIAPPGAEATATAVAVSQFTLPPNQPIWSIYSYTCALASGGAQMTMKLAWSSRSNNQTGYHVYRDNQIIATLAPNVNNYQDVVFIPTGGTVSYWVEAFNTTWRLNSSTITYGCK